MTTAKDLPEEATEEPRILSPAEDTERASERLERSKQITDADEAEELADARSPLRIPGESSPKPRERVAEDRRAAAAMPRPGRKPPPAR
jgi:hypothetical protein